MLNRIGEFRDAVYKTEIRNFPWRERADPWGVLLSEYMLQQTQTERVIPYWNRWMTLWPSPSALHRASLEDALREWSGLGYNRRCRYVKECAGIIAGRYGGVTPETPDALRLLPGIGAYTAGAIACFAYNYPAVFIETNIRAAVIYFFFADYEIVRDADILSILEYALTFEKENPRRWYWSLMDYGAALKKSGLNPNRKSAHYVKQSRFEGSFRQRRGAAVKSLVSQGPADAGELAARTGFTLEEIRAVLTALQKESLVAETEGVYKIAEPVF
ncbi:MAG: A/G-specific adenine glycosylase [Spirochaetaceae bacterium]|jgi:A/G-specific adenine glycosylase|nr:A/G-specific adenine glycosylase [Spirochaetaceae bacterium]